MRARTIGTIVILGIIAVIGTAVPAGAGGTNGEAQINAVVNGTPSSQLQVRYTCVGGSSPAGPQVVSFNASLVVLPSTFIDMGGCTVEVLAQDGLVPSFTCVPTVSVACDPGNASVHYVGGSNNETAVITVTFNPGPPTPTTTSPATTESAAALTAQSTSTG